MVLCSLNLHGEENVAQKPEDCNSIPIYLKTSKLDLKLGKRAVISKKEISYNIIWEAFKSLV